MVARKIVVGYDGSPDARRAARWALDEAARIGAPVEFCYAFAWPAYLPAGAMMPAPAAWPCGDTEQGVADMVDSAGRAAVESHPEVRVSTMIVRAPAIPSLIERSAEAGLVVLGSRGHSAVADLLGSVAAEVSAHAHCPVMAVRGNAAAGDPVVVGLDDAASEPALVFAFEQAARRRTALRVLRAWWPPTDGDAAAVETATASERTAVTDLVGTWWQTWPAVPVTVDLVIDDAGHALTEASFDAQLVVVGSRGLGALRGVLLGSVSRHLLRHAACSVAVVRGMDRPDPR